MRSRRFGRRRFRGRRHVARQYRSWDLLHADFTSDITAAVPLTTLTLDPDNSIFLADVVGQPVGEIVPQGTQIQQDTQTFGITGITPLVHGTHFAEHGEDFTLRALHGYVWPLTLETFDSVTGAQSEVKNECLCRLALAQIEVAPDFIERATDAGGTLAAAGAVPRTSVWRRRDLKQRIWWMRDFFIVTNDVGHSLDWPGNTGGPVWNPNLFDGRHFGIHLPRFNFKVRRTTIPALLWGVSGALPGTAVAPVTAGSAFSHLSGESKVQLDVNMFLRTFITR